MKYQLVVWPGNHEPTENKSHFFKSENTLVQYPIAARVGFNSNNPITRTSLKRTICKIH